MVLSTAAQLQYAQARAALDCFDERRFDATATLLPDGRVLVTGGHSRSDILRFSEIYDPSTGRWGSSARMACSSMAHTATLLLDGTVLVAGGGQGGPAIAGAEFFYPGSGG